MMTDTQLTQQLLISLADAIRDVPEGAEHRALTDRFFALVRHLESKAMIEEGKWRLDARKERR